MAFSLQLFLDQINSIESIINKNTNDDAVIGVYLADLRTPLFQIQGLARLYEKAYKKEKTFSKIKEQSKELEDALGRYDHALYTSQNLTQIRKYSAVNDILTDAEESTYNHLKKVLDKSKWLNGKRLKKWRERLSEVNWKSEKDDRTHIQKVYSEEVEDAQAFMNELTFPLTDIEMQVHELRRKLRWLSIYVHATQGLFKLHSDVARTQKLKALHIKVITESPYVQVHMNEQLNGHITLSQGDFIGLSWVIYHVGRLKDTGLLQWEFDQIIQNNSIPKTTVGRIKKELNWTTDNENKTLADSEKIIKKFSQHQVLENLLLNSED